jgi:hypothetical protein
VSASCSCPRPPAVQLNSIFSAKTDPRENPEKNPARIEAGSASFKGKRGEHDTIRQHIYKVLPENKMNRIILYLLVRKFHGIIQDRTSSIRHWVNLRCIHVAFGITCVICFPVCDRSSCYSNLEDGK